MRTALIVLVLSVAATAVHAQFASAELSGTVTSSTASALHGVTVTALDVETGLQRRAMTAADGSYSITGLRPATYRVTFELQKFASVEVRGVELRLGQTTDLPVTLDLASLDETVTVVARPQLVDVQAVQIGGTVTADEFLHLPTQNRSFVLFAALLPGVIPNPQTSSSSASALYVNGQHQANNSFRVDGTGNDDPTVGSQAGAQVRTPIEAIQEFQIVTSQQDAEFGGATGGVLNAITRSGTNQVKGSAFVFFQDASWNAVDLFTRRAGLDPANASLTSAGVTVGGPILTDRTHYFVSFEHTQDREGHARSFLARPELSYSTTEDNRVRNVLIRADHGAGRHHGSFRYLAEDAPQLNTIVGVRSAEEGAREEHDSDFNAIAALDTVGDSRFSSLRVGYTHEHFINAASPFGNWARDFVRLRRLEPLLSRPSVEEGASNIGQDQMNETLDAAHSASWMVRAHEIRAGVQWTRRAIDLTSFGSANGRFEFDTDRPFDPNAISTYPTSFTIRVGGAASTAAQRLDTVGVFLQDQWRVRSNLTISAGLRWDRDDAVNDRDNFAPRVGFAWSVPSFRRTVIRGGFGRFYDRMRLGPWSLPAADAVRLTNGILIRVPDAGNNRQLFFELAQQNGITSIVQLRDILARQLEQGTTGQLNANPTVDHRDRVQPYVDTLTLGAQREISAAVAIGIDLVHSTSRETLVSVDLNPFSRSRGGRPNISVLDGEVVRLGSISTLMNAGTNRYGAVQLSVHKRMSDAFGGRISYTWADSQGTYGNAGPLGAPNTAYFQTRSETGYNFDTGEIIGEPLNLNLGDSRNGDQPVGWHRRHNVSFAGAWKVPGTSRHRDGGLLLSWVYRYMSGDRFTIFTTELLDNGNRAPMPSGVYDATTPSDVAQNDVSFGGTLFGAENPDFSRVDLSLRYTFPLAYREARLTFIGDVFNAANTTNFVNAGGSVAGTPAFLTPTATFSPREFQLGARLTF